MAVFDRDESGGSGEGGEIERILRDEELIEPSQWFSRHVMESVRREAAAAPAAAPAPIAFPWQRWVAGLAACGALIAAGAAALSSSAGELRPPALSLGDPFLAVAASGLGWTLAALAGTYLLTWLARRLVQA
jgi:hypothetical protein